MTGPVRRCDTCGSAEVLVASGRRVCTDPEVNVPTPAFLAGCHAVARSCILERGTRIGACGPAGKRWRPRPDDLVLGPAAGLDRLDV
ncbi:MAG: hypothetical protein KA200_00440 [Burkholderiales bacterium]|nr:hypothetical protein [Burkholderiales bacterium]